MTWYNDSMHGISSSWVYPRKSITITTTITSLVFPKERRSRTHQLNLHRCHHRHQAMATQVKSLTGKVALGKHELWIQPEQLDISLTNAVTGSSRGIGAAIVTRLASHGANVVVNYHSSPDAAEAVAEKCRSFGVCAICVKADVSKPESIAQLFETTIKEFGGVDIVMSNSGVEHFDDIQNVKGEDIDKVFGVNVKGQFMVAQQAFTHVRNNGRVVLMSSISAVWVN